MRRGQTEERRARSKDAHLSRESARLRVLCGDDSTNRGPALRGRMSERDGLIPLRVHEHSVDTSRCCGHGQCLLSGEAERRARVHPGRMRKGVVSVSAFA